MELIFTNTTPEETDQNTILGGAFTVIMIIIGFWGLPFLHKTKNNILRKTGFIIFWAFVFYIIAVAVFFIIAVAFSNTNELSESATALILLASAACSLMLGLMGRLPFMRS